VNEKRPWAKRKATWHKWFVANRETRNKRKRAEVADAPMPGIARAADINMSRRPETGDLNEAAEPELSSAPATIIGAEFQIERRCGDEPDLSICSSMRPT